MKNALLDWINKDKKLHDLLSGIEATGKSPIEQAEIGFYKIAELYKLPLMPNDVPKDDEQGVSLYEEHALIKFLEDNKTDPRGFVLSAAYHLVNGYRVDLYQVIEKEFGENAPANCRIGIKGDGFNGEVVFPQKETKSWIELGCKIMRQPI